MSNVKIISNETLNDEQKKVLEQFEKFQQAMIDKDEEKLHEIILDGYTLTHMSGKTQTKGEFIGEIMDNTLNYYESTIQNPRIKVMGNHAQLVADVTLDAKVYGMKGVWTLHTVADFELVDNTWLFGKWDN